MKFFVFKLFCLILFFFLRHERQQRVVDPMCICSAMIMVQLNFSMENKIFKVNSGKVSDSSIALVFDIELILYKKGLCLSSRKPWLEESTWNEIFENDTLVSCETDIQMLRLMDFKNDLSKVFAVLHFFKTCESRYLSVSDAPFSMFIL